MKFENIKIGDNVLVEEAVMYGYGRGKAFAILDEVVRVTKTQFTTKTGKRYKKNGSEVGRFSRAFFVGDKTYCNEAIVDQTDMMNNFKRKLLVESQINKKIQKLNIEFNSNLSIDILVDINCKLDDITKLFNIDLNNHK